MTIPSSNEIIRPVLEYLARNEEPVKLAILVESLKKKFEMTKEEMKETVDSGGNRFRARTITAINKMKSSRQISSPQRGYLAITEKGREEVGETTGSKLRPPLPVGDVPERRTYTIPQDDKIAEVVGQIITTHLSHTTVNTKELPTLIRDIYDALSGAKQQPASSTPSSPERTTSQDPPVPIENSVTDDHIICLECGKPFVSLKRHLGAHHLTTPEKYRDKWGLPANYPMITKKSSEKRSETAKNMGLRQMGQAARQNQGQQSA